MVVTATDPDGGTASVPFEWVVNNPPPVAGDNTFGTNHDEPVTIDVLADDSDPDGDTLTIDSVTQPANGSVVVNPDGTVTYTPDAGFEGTDTFTYTVSDGNGGTDTATVSVQVPAGPQIPVATAIDTQSDDDADQLTLDVSGSFLDPNGDPLTFSANGLPPGLAIDPTTGVISGTIAPDASQGGPYSVTITAVDPDGNAVSTTFAWNVANPAPVAGNNTTSTAEDKPVTIAVLGNDSDPDGDGITVTATTPPANGTVTINPDGSITYTPDPGFNGTDIFTYTIDDGNGGTDTAIVTVNVGPVNDNPVDTAIPEQSANDGTTIPTLDVAPFFSDPDGDLLSFAATGLPPGVTMNPDGNVTGTIDPDASIGGPNGDGVYEVTVTADDGNGGVVTSTFTYTVGNLPPVAVDEVASGDEDTAQSGNVLGNDADPAPDGDALTVSEVNGMPGLVGLPVALTYGSVAVNADGTWTFTPNAAANSLAAGDTVSETITYQVSDGNGGFDTAVLTIEIVGFNDAPGEQGPIADQSNDDGETITPLDVGSIFKDPDGDPLAFTATGLPPGLVIDPTTGVITGTLDPDASQGGPYMVTVTSTDPDGNTASMTFEWAVNNPAPVAEDNTVSTAEDTAVLVGVLGNDSDPDGDLLTVVDASDPANGSVVINPDGTITYTPEPGYNGTDTFTYTISDGNGGLATATVTVSIGVVNDNPVGTPINPQTSDDTEAPTLDVSGNFSDPDGQPLTFNATGLPPGLSIDPTTGVISGTIDPDASQGGPYNVVVTATDLDGGTASVPFVWVVNNPPPVAVDNVVGTEPGVPVTLDVLVNDIDPDGDPLTVQSVTQPANGTVVINPDGTVTYTPDAGFSGTDTFTYFVSDGNGGTDTGTVSVQVPAGPQIPLVTPIDPQSDDDGATISLDVLNNFTDPNGLLLTFSAIGLPPGLVIDPVICVISGIIDPDASLGGPYPVTITAVDADGNTVSTTFLWNVANPAPVAEGNTTSTPEDTPVTIGVLGNDVDPDGDPVEITGVTQPSNGAVTINPDGTITYTPEPGFVGTDTFTYTINDGNGGTDTATVSVNVGPVNDSPIDSVIPPQAADDGETVTPLDVSGAFIDPDGDPLTFAAEGLPPGLVIDPVTGIITGTIDPGASEDGPYTVTIIARDPNGGEATTTFTWDVANLPPVAIDDTESVGEDDANTTGNVLTDAVTGDDDTAPDSDPLTVAGATQGGNTITLGVPFTTAGGGILTLSADGSYTFAPGRAYNGLDEGETATETISYTISDGNGGSDEAVLVITVNGGNDVPVVVDPDDPINPSDPDPAEDPLSLIGNIDSTDGATPVPLDVTPFFVDPDGETLSYSVTGLPEGLSIDPATGLITGVFPNDASQGGPGSDGVYKVKIIATDPDGATAELEFTYTITNPPPVAEGEESSGNEDTAQSGNVLPNDADTAPDSDLLTVGAIAGGSVGQPIALTHGTLVMNTNGSWTFTPNTTANALAQGEVVTETVTYTVSDGQGGTDTAVLEIEIVGVNDLPVAAELPDRSNHEGNGVSVDAGSGFSDPDGDDLDFTATGLPPGLSIDPETGLITGTVAPGASNGGPYTVTVTANDGHGGLISTTFDWVVLALPVATDDPGVDPPADDPRGPHVAGPYIDPVVLNAVNSLKPLNGTPDLTDWAVADAVEGLGSLNSSLVFSDGDNVIADVVEWLGRQGRDAAWLQDVFDNFEHHPYAGDTLELALAVDGQELFRVKSIILDGAMFIGVDTLLNGAEVNRIQGAGANMAWIDSQNLVVNVAGAAEWIDLTIHGHMAGGRMADWNISINTQSGEIVAGLTEPGNQSGALREALVEMKRGVQITQDNVTSTLKRVLTG